MQVLGFAINVLILAWIARRLLGVPVGWGRLIVVSAIAASTASLGIVEVFAFFGISVASPPLPILLVSAVLLGCVIALELIVLTVMEVIVPTRSMPSPISVIAGIPAAARRLRRYLAIWWILMRRGLTAYLSPTRNADVESTRVARSLRLAMSDAGVTFVKFGQMLATRADLLPAPFIRELSKLHSNVAAEPWDAVRPVVVEGFDRPLDEVFAELDEQPMAAASVAQIHAARLADGTDVVVKVQRPKARAQVTADLDILHRLATRLEHRTSWGRSLGAVALADGFARSLHEELDYTVEMRNMLAVDAASDLLVPKPIQQLCSERVIVMTRIDGKPLSSAQAELAELPAEQRATLADRLLSGVPRQIFVTGTFHADLHPGNVIYTSDGDLALLDFGSVGRLDRPTRNALILLLYAVERQDPIAATDTLLDLMDRPVELDDRALEREVGSLLLQYGGGLPAGGAASMFTELIDLIVGHGFRVPPQLAAVFRTLSTLDGTLRLLDPDVDMIAIAKVQGAELAQSMLGREAVQAQIEHQLATVLPILARLPRRLSRITEQLEDGSFSVNVRTLRHTSDRAYVASLSDQLTLTLLGSVLGVGGLFLLTQDGGPVLVEDLPLWPFLGVTLLFLAFTLGARVLSGIFFRNE